MLVEDTQTLLLLRIFALDFPGGSAGGEYTCNVGDLGLILRLGRSPGEGNGYFPSMEFHGLYCPWGPKELDMTEQLSLSLSFRLCFSPDIQMTHSVTSFRSLLRSNLTGEAVYDHLNKEGFPFLFLLAFLFSHCDVYCHYCSSVANL